MVKISKEHYLRVYFGKQPFEAEGLFFDKDVVIPNLDAISVPGNH